MNPFKCGCNFLGCLLSSAVLWLLLAFAGQWLILGLSPRDSGFYPVEAALTYASYTVAAVAILVFIFAIYHYTRRDPRRRYEPLTYLPSAPSNV